MATSRPADATVLEGRDRRAARRGTGRERRLSDQLLVCDGHPVTVRVNDAHSSDHGGWSSAQIVSGGEGHLTPLSFGFTLHDDTLGVTLFSGTELKGGGHPGSGRTTVTCTQSETATLADVLDPGEQPPPGVDLADTVTQTLVVVAFRQP